MDPRSETAKQIPPKDFDLFVDHLCQVLREAAATPDYKSTGKLAKYDAMLLNAASLTAGHWPFNLAMLTTRNYGDDKRVSGLGVLAELCAAASEEDAMMDPEQAKDMVRLCSCVAYRGTTEIITENTSIRDNRHNILRRMDSCGLLGHLFQAMLLNPADPEVRNEMQRQSLSLLTLLQGDPRIVAKRLGKDGIHSSGQILLDIVLNRFKQPMEAELKPILTAMKRLCEMANFAQPYMAKDVRGEVMSTKLICYHCMKTVEKLFHCARCYTRGCTFQ